MSNAEMAIRHSILTGMDERNAWHEIISPSAAVDAVMECVFGESTRWAVEAYMEELSK